MTEDKATPQEDDVDPQVAEYYASLGDESAPSFLDHAVMRNARQALRADNRKGPYGAWFRPVAFVTMAVLCLSIVIDLGNLGIFGAPDSVVDAAPPAAGDRTIAPPLPGQGQAVLNEIKRQEKSAVSALQSSGMRDGDAAEPREGRQTKLQAAPAPASAAAKAAAAEESPAPDSPPCGAEQSATPAGWWDCIESLREAGMADAADLEYDRLIKQFPDFTPPD